MQVDDAEAEQEVPTTDAVRREGAFAAVRCEPVGCVYLVRT